MPKTFLNALQLESESTNVPALPPRYEWLFRKVDVPDDELIACTCWEYLREVSPDHLGHDGLSGYAQRLLINYRTHDERRKFNDSFHRIPANILFLLASSHDFATPLQPWQRLDQSLRQRLNQPMPRAWKPLIEMDVFAVGLTSWELKMPAPGDFKVPRPSLEHELELYAWAVAHEARRRAVDTQGKSSDEMRAIPRSTEFEKTSDAIHSFSVHDPRHWLVSYAANELARPAPFLINWGEYTAEEIADGFRTWVHRVHPKFAPIPRRKGTKVSAVRGALRDLAAMRIMNVMPADEFIERYDSAYQLVQQPWDSNTTVTKLPHVDLIKLRKRAVNFFASHFAIDPNIKPRSWRKPRTEKRTPADPTGDLPDFKVKKKEQTLNR